MNYLFIIPVLILIVLWIKVAFTKKCPECRHKMKLEKIQDPMSPEKIGKSIATSVMKPVASDQKMEYIYYCENCNNKFKYQNNRFLGKL